jgi:hypothetical protein
MTMTCTYCRGVVGGDSGELPIHVPDERGDKNETWCPQCFVWRRAPLEPHRFHASAMAAVKCARCGVTSVDFGRGACSQCLAVLVVVLPPKPIVAPAA